MTTQEIVASNTVVVELCDEVTISMLKEVS